MRRDQKPGILTRVWHGKRSTTKTFAKQDMKTCGFRRHQDTFITVRFNCPKGYIYEAAINVKWLQDRICSFMKS